jgi:sialate O-acetylesterase
VVAAETVESPAAVRYAWDDNPEGANLIGAAGLPVGHFKRIIGRR